MGENFIGEVISLCQMNICKVKRNIYISNKSVNSLKVHVLLIIVHEFVYIRTVFGQNCTHSIINVCINVVYSDIILAVCFAMRCCISYRLFFGRYLPRSGKRPARTEHSVAPGGVTSEATRPDLRAGRPAGRVVVRCRG